MDHRGGHEPVERARHLRKLAQQLRAVAETISDGDAKAGLLAAAGAYERLATTIEEGSSK